MYNGVRMSHLFDTHQNNNKQRYITLFKKKLLVAIYLNMFFFICDKISSFYCKNKCDSYTY